MKFPCENCITFPMCLAISYEKGIRWIAHLSNKCYLLNDYIESSLMKSNDAEKSYNMLFKIFRKE